MCHSVLAAEGARDGWTALGGTNICGQLVGCIVRTGVKSIMPSRLNSLQGLEVGAMIVHFVIEV